METAIAPPLPLVTQLTKEQRSALLVDLIKAHFAELGMPWYLSVRDGDRLLGTFHPEFPRPEKTLRPDFPPEFLEEMKRRNEEITSGRAKLLSKKEFLDLVEKELDCKHPE